MVLVPMLIIITKIFKTHDNE